METKRLGRWAPMLVLAAALVMFVAGANVVDAAKGGSHGRGGTPPPATGTCSVTPNPAARWSAVTISGSAFSAYASVGITVRSVSGNVAMMFASADSSGRFSAKYNTVWLGTNAVTASGGGVTASCSFGVV